MKESAASISSGVTLMYIHDRCDNDLVERPDDGGVIKLYEGIRGTAMMAGAIILPQSRPRWFEVLSSSEYYG